MGGHQSSVSTALRNGCAGTGTQASICLIWEEWIDENIHITHTQRYTQKHQVYFFQGTWIYGSWDPLAVNMYNLSAEQKASQWGASQQCGGVIVWWRAHVHMNGCMFACVCVCVRVSVKSNMCTCLNILVFSQFDTLAGLVMASRSRATSVGAKKLWRSH